MLDRLDCRTANDENHVRTEFHQLRRVRSGATRVGQRKTIIDVQIAAFDPAEALEFLPQRGCLLRVIPKKQCPNEAHPVGLLRTCQKWPRRRRAAEQCDEIPSSHARLLTGGSLPHRQ
jgi:hypothetical protein